MDAEGITIGKAHCWGPNKASENQIENSWAENERSVLENKI